jgi:glycosyltransferase involved in cell wall biosynthesis
VDAVVIGDQDAHGAGIDQQAPFLNPKLRLYKIVMKLLFINNQPVRFNVETPAREPLGGTESAIAYLALQLAANGHDVTIVTELPPATPERLGGVRHLPIAAIGDAAFFAAEDFDAVIAVSAPMLARSLRQMAPRALHIAWLHALPDQPGMKPLAEMTPFIDCAVFVSEWQRRAVRFAGGSHVIGNGIAPAFENLFGSAEELAAAKENRAAYTTTPFRGLNVLTRAFGEARLTTELEVWSGMRIYQSSDTPFEEVYAAARATPRLHLQDPVGQQELAQRLKRVAFLFYPCVYFETYCITTLEAIAAGLKVVATDIGALKETTLGFADLMPAIGLSPDDLARVFAARLEQAEAAFLADRRAFAQERFAQSQAVSRHCNWAARAKEWEDFLAPAFAWKRGA